MRAQFKLRNGNGQVMGWVKVASIVFPFIVSVAAGAVVIGQNLRETRENTSDIVMLNQHQDEILRTVQNIELTIQRDHMIDSIMFVSQAKILRKLNIPQ
jgi:hypothetical protein